MATKMIPAHRELDGQPIKTADVTRKRKRRRPRVPADTRAPNILRTRTSEKREED